MVTFRNNNNVRRNNHNASKLIEKYNDLAREASSNGDKILSENYFQHADHFTRVLNEQENSRKLKYLENKEANIELSANPSNLNNNKDNTIRDNKDVTSENETVVKNQTEAN